MDLFAHPCPYCTGNDINVHTSYSTQEYGSRVILHCRQCDIYFSETFATPISGLKNPLSRIITILKARSEGMGLNATARVYQVSKKSVIDWERRLADLKPTLMLYSLVHELIHQEIEGDELYTKVNQNKPPSDSPRLDDCFDGARKSFSVGVTLWAKRLTIIREGFTLLESSN